MNFQPTDYRFSLAEAAVWKQFLAEHGFVVIANAVSPEIAAAYAEEMRATLGTLSEGKLDPNDPSTWAKSDNYPYSLYGGMIQYVGHAGFQWDAREAVRPVFAEVWDCAPQDLATSFDGFAYMDASRSYTPKPMNSFLHSDQAPSKNYRWSVQGLLNLYDNPQAAGGLVVVPDSHHWHPDYFQEKELLHLQEDWYKIPDEDKMQPRFQDLLKVCAEAGDLLLWDSRVFHCNCFPQKGHRRACVYICQLPKSHIPNSVRAQRREAWTEKRTTNHYPGAGFRVFPKLPRFADRALEPLVTQVSRTTLNPAQTELAYLD